VNRRTPDQSADNEADTNSIKREIERTRVEMSETIGQIQDRLRPDHLLQQAKDGVTEAAAGKVRNIMYSAGETAQTVATRARGVGGYLACYATDHPIRVAVTVGALTWWTLRGRNRSEDWYGTAETAWDRDNYGSGETLSDKAGAYASSARETVAEYASSARQTVGEYTTAARETAGEYAESARDQARRASERARSAANTASVRARETWQQTSTSVDHFVHDHPMAAGALAVAVGAAIGLCVPATEIENRTMGETRDQAWARASRVARDLKENVTQRVTSVAEGVMGESLTGERQASTESDMGRA
jgi:ElaB/YqjD/DUF883 family membrane-anchored ribosome-binding protein